ncbi:hypothetical protein LTS10_008069 [Elasticomyces elasticus]|nr:hypothetical protein LTS10_008069 [Elasticomyces elasticus]
MWIDAVGINQSDNEERASQVSFMGEVYKSAAKTYVWLGCSVEPDSPVHDMHSLHRMLLRMVQAVPQIMSDIRLPGSVEIKVWGLCLALTAGFYTLDRALSHQTPSWQTRAWVLQEYILSSTPYFCWDRRRLRKVEKSKAFAYAIMLRALWYRGNILLLSDFLETLAGINMPHERLPPHNILRVSALAAESQASNPHDRVFALLGFIEQESSRHILVDYTAPFWVTCARATYASSKHVRTNCYECMDDWNRLIFLEHITNQPDRPPSFPSWVVDFTWLNKRSFSLMTDFRWPGSRDHFDAELSTDLLRLTTHGVRFGRVVTVLPMYKRASPWYQEHPVDFFTEDVPPSGQVALFTKLLASALQAHEASGPCHHAGPNMPSSSNQLAELEYHLEHQRGRDVPFQDVMKVLDPCFSCWKSHLAQHRSADGSCRCRLWRVRGPETVIWTILLLSSSIQLFASDDGYVGFAPRDIKVGDTIVFLRGATWPTLLWQSEGRWAFRSLVYLCGVMHRELQGEQGEPSWETEAFVLH